MLTYEAIAGEDLETGDIIYLDQNKGTVKLIKYNFIERLCHWIGEILSIKYLKYWREKKPIGLVFKSASIGNKAEIAIYGVAHSQEV